MSNASCASLALEDDLSLELKLSIGNKEVASEKVLLAIGVAAIWIVEIAFYILVYVDKWSRQGLLINYGCFYSFPFLRNRNSMLNFISAGGITMVFVITSGFNIVNRNNVSCTTALWLQAIAIPLSIFPIIIRFYIYLSKIKMGNIAASKFRETYANKYSNNKKGNSKRDLVPSSPSKDGEKETVTSGGTPKDNLHDNSAMHSTSSIRAAVELMGGHARTSSAGSENAFELSRGKRADSNAPDIARTDSKSSANGIIGRELAVSMSSIMGSNNNNSIQERPPSVSLSIPGNSNNNNSSSSGNKVSSIFDMLKMVNLPKTKRAIGFIYLLTLFFPIILILIIVTSTKKQYELGCSGCLYSKTEASIWILSSIFITVSSIYIISQLRKFPDPLLFQNELITVLVTFIILVIPGMILAIIDPTAIASSLLLCIACLFIHFETTARFLILSFRQGHNLKNSPLIPVVTPLNGKIGSSPGPVSLSNAILTSKLVNGASSPQTRPASGSVSNNNSSKEQKYTVEELVTTMSHTPLGQLFERHLIAEHNDENIEFMRNVLLFEQRYDEDEREFRQKKAKRIYDTYIKFGSTSQINISHSQRTFLDEKFSNSPKPNATSKYVKKYVFRDAKLEIILLMENDSLPRFLNSNEFKSYVTKMKVEHQTTVSIQYSTSISNL